ncbi:hypothetical protein [Rhizobium sp.]|uniref:hypothetical protein n=1 Tax=Rhizobium sp. TaxID=391 RepID=UPI0028B0A01F
MRIEDMIEALEGLSAPDRKSDEAIARLCGYSLDIVPGDANGGEQKKVWSFGDPPEPTRLPTFTSNLDRAMQFAEAKFPNHAAAISWRGERYQARLNEDGPVADGPTAALALCIATLRTMMANQS